MMPTHSDEIARIEIDPCPLFELSPQLYMQFMEPLGLTDASVEGAWDFDRDDWRADFLATTKDLAPDVIRWGGLFCRYYKWREGVGPVENRPRMRNYLWDGSESNRVGTVEFVDLCRRVGAEPLLCVNFDGDGEARWKNTREGDRSGDAQEAADWVSYANDPKNAERRAHGFPEPLGVKWWQIGNETSYSSHCFSKDESITRTEEFARAMRQRDDSIKIIGWGDDNGGQGEIWAGDLIERAGDSIDAVAIHMMGQFPRRKNTVLRENLWQNELETAWDELRELADQIETRLNRILAVVESKNSAHGVAITEGHLSIAPRNLNSLLTEWICGVYHARSMNLYQRAARVQMATCADFQGNRWTANALMMEVPGQISYLLPAGAVMRLFKRHNGKQAVSVVSKPKNLDIAASRDGNRFFLHVANLEFKTNIETEFFLLGWKIVSGKIWQIAPDSIRQQATETSPDVFTPRQWVLPANGKWNFPAASVSVVELLCEPI